MVQGCTQMGAHCTWMGAHGTQMDIYKIPIFTQLLHFLQLSTISTSSYMEIFMYNKYWPWWPMKCSIQRCCSWRDEGDEAPPRLEVPDTNPVLEVAIIKAREKHVEGEAPTSFPEKANYSTHASSSFCLDNQEQYL